MRVIAGKFRGRRIDPVPGEDTRPTADRVREAIASSIISKHPEGFEGAHLLDAFAGSGAMGIEALSRGASCVTFVDSDPAAASTIKGNLSKLPLDGASAYVRRDDLDAIRRRTDARETLPLMPGAPFRLVFLDPPYAVDVAQVSELAVRFADGGWFEPGALLVYELSSKGAAGAAGAGKAGKRPRGKRDPRRARGEIPEGISEMARALEGRFAFVDLKSYGGTLVVYFRYAKGGDEAASRR